jgi:hypothetical protein
MDDDRPVTRRDIEVTKRELNQAIEETKRELKEAIGEAVNHAIKEAADSLTELVRDTETKLLTAFHGYAKGTAARFQRTEISEAANAARIEALESRVLELETRQDR